VKKAEGRRQKAEDTSSFILLPSAFCLLIFLAARVPLLVLRAPFFDELFTRWIAGRSFSGILSALRQDSGPPLYYFAVHLLGDPSVEATRVLSLICAGVAFVVILLRDRGVRAGLLLAVFPPAVLIAADARSYALCAMFVTMAILAVDRDRPMLAALLLVAAAYSHYYGVLFFPMLLLGSANGRAGGPTPVRRRLLALLLTVFLYIPGFLLALQQPAEARAWMTMSWPDALFVRPPLMLAIIGAVALALSIRVNRYLFMVLIPLILAIALRVYVPMRFESVIAAPLALCLAESLRNNRYRLVLTTALIAVGALWTTLGIIDHVGRPPDPYRQAARWIASNLPADATVVASGYCYLETIMNGHARVAACPPEQGEHPGWRALPRQEVPIPSGAFYWTGERAAPELGILMRTRRTIKPLFINDRAMVALVR
jgi:hypothetical protein